MKKYVCIHVHLNFQAPSCIIIPGNVLLVMVNLSYQMIHLLKINNTAQTAFASNTRIFITTFLNTLNLMLVFSL